jgi:hypothetical protein
MSERLKSKNALIFSYLTLRKAIGVLGTSLPFVLSLGALVLFGTGIQGSVSGYYHTGMRDVFVGVLCVIGFFLLSYRGYNGADDIVGDLGCLFAVGVALFPTTPSNAASSGVRIIGYVHFVFAVLFLLTLIYFSLFLFTKTEADPNQSPTPRKLQRNRVYKACGYTMLLCIVLIAIYYRLPDELASPIEGYKPVFWLESIAVVAFGISWLTKGEAIRMLNDKA